MKRLIKNLKKVCLYFFRLSFKNREEYVQYGMSPVFIVCTNRDSCIMGHMSIKKSDTNEQIKDNMIKCVSKICKKENLTEEQTVKAINNNLKSNGLL